MCGSGLACEGLLALHILGVVLFLGGLLLAVWWKVGADRTGDPAFVARVHERLGSMDNQIIGPGALLTFAAGYAMIRFFGSKIAENPFALWGLILMFLAMGFWFFGMRRALRALQIEAEACWTRKQPLTKEFGRRSVGYLGSAFVAIALVLVVALLMVFKWPTRLWPF